MTMSIWGWKVLAKKHQGQFAHIVREGRPVKWSKYTFSIHLFRIVH